MCIAISGRDIVVGPSKKEQMVDLLNAWEEGKLEESIFNEITEMIINTKLLAADLVK